MHRQNLLKIGTSTFLILLLSIGFFAFAQPQPQPLQETPWDFPRLDELWMIEAFPRSVAMDKARACDIDNYPGMITKTDIIELRDVYGWTVTSTPGYHMCYVGFNCRDYTPSDSGGTLDNCGRLPGDPLYPLNVSQFRMALQLIVGCEKDAWIADIYGFVNVRLDTCVPFANAFWYNPYILPYPEDWDKAVAVLLGGGFTVDDGADDTLHTTDDIWYMPNGVQLIGGPTSAHPGSHRVCGYLNPAHTPNAWGIQALLVGKGVAPTSYEVMARHVEKWNNFFTGVVIDSLALETACGCDPAGCVDGALFHIRDCNPISIMTDITFCNRDHDLYMLCWGLDRNPDYLYYFFHPDMDVYDGSNSPGLDHPGLNRLLSSLAYWSKKDYELLAVNNGQYPAGLVIPACTIFGPIGPFAAPVEKTVEIEHCDQDLGVYDEELVDGVDFNNNWVHEADGWYVYIHIKHDITLYVADALEVKFPFCTYYKTIYSLDEMREIVWLIQWKLYYLCPYCPIYSRKYFDLYKPGLTCFVEMPGFGSAAYQLVVPWTFASIHWTGQAVGGSMKWAVTGDVFTLNPFKVVWVYEVTVLNRMYDSLYVVNPYLGTDMPWIATHWEILPWTVPTGETGMIIKVFIRDDVYWQDGLHVTAKDIKWSYDFVNSTQAPEFTAIISPIYQGIEVINDYCLKIYVNATGMWKVYDYLGGTALMFPKIVWQPFWGDYAGASAFKPWEKDYQTHTGRVPTGGRSPMTCLFGTGPWWLDYWDGVATAHVVKNTNYWVRKAAMPNGVLGAIRAKTQHGYKYFRYNLDKKPYCQSHGLIATPILPENIVNYPCFAEGDITISCGSAVCEYYAELEIILINLNKLTPVNIDVQVEAFPAPMRPGPPHPPPPPAAINKIVQNETCTIPAIPPYGVVTFQSPILRFRLIGFFTTYYILWMKYKTDPWDAAHAFNLYDTVVMKSHQLGGPGGDLDCDGDVDTSVDQPMYVRSWQQYCAHVSAIAMDP